MTASASKGAIGKGAVLSIMVSSTATPVAQIKTLQLNGQKVSYDDISNLDSPALGTSLVAVKEKLPATAEAGTLAISGIYLPANAGYEALAAAYLTQALTTFTMQLPIVPGQTTSGNLYSLSGYVSEAPHPDVQWDKTMMFKCTIELAANPTFTQGS
jgi:hypothetical protein